MPERPLNVGMIRDNLEEAREELDRLLQEIGEDISDEELQVGFEHALHHLCFAWNARRAPRERVSRLSDEDFNRWSRIPSDLKPYVVNVKR